jgi:hypothetical protein
MDQHDLQIWNDAVDACKRAAMEQVMDMESAASDGMPNPARAVIRAVGAQFRGGDDRNIIHGFDASQFPAPPTQKAPTD